MDFTHPHFQEPRWLLLALLGALGLLVLLRYAAAARRRQLARIVTPERLPGLTASHSPMRRALKHGILILVVILVGLTLARPQWGELESGDRWLADDVVFVLDASRSMLATDVAPNRLQRAKFAVLDFVRRHGTGRVGLVAFSGAAFLQCPLTFDYDAFEESLKAMDERTIPVGGTDIGRALEEGFHAMEKRSPRKHIVLITDGEDLEKGGVKQAEALAKEGVTIYTIGVGTPAGAELRILTPTGQFDYVRDSSGQVVLSRLDEETLTAIARASGGEYFPLGRLGEGLTRVRQAIERVDAASFARNQTQGVERFYIPLALALLLLVVESLIGTRRRPQAENVMNRTLLKTATALLAMWSWGGPTTQGETFVSTNAAAHVPPPPAPKTAQGLYNAGTEQIGAGKFKEAEALLQAALGRQDEAVQSRAIYNLGVVRFEEGREELKKSPESQPTKQRGERAALAADEAIQTAEAALASNDIQKMVAAYMRGRGTRKELKAAYGAVHQALEQYAKTLEKWRRSLGDFHSTTELNPADTNAFHNSEVVERSIAQLVDSVRQTQSLGMKCAGNCSKLGDALSQLKGKIPKDQMPPGAAGDKDEDEEGTPQLEDLLGQKEGGPKEGQKMETSLSPEEAASLLDGFKLGGEHRLPMGDKEQAKPLDRKLRDW